MISVAKPQIGADERSAVDRVLRSGLLAQGPEVAAFEHEFADQLVAGRECVAVSSGTSGLHLGLLAAGVGPGDEVIVPSFTAFVAGAIALVLIASGRLGWQGLAIVSAVTTVQLVTASLSMLQSKRYFEELFTQAAHSGVGASALAHPRTMAEFPG